MQEDKKISILNRVETGKIFLNINNSIYSMHTPNKEQRAISELVYRETFDDSKYSELITREQVKILLERKGVWSSQDDKALKDYQKYLEDLKINLYESLYNMQVQSQLRKRIKALKDGINKSYAKKFSLDHITLESHAETARDEFLVALTIKDSNNNYVYNYENWSKIDNYILQRFLNFISSNIITTEEYREIARTEPFRSKWSLFKQDLFSSQEFSAEQLTLCMYARMYDNVYEHPEKPTDEVIEDDDMLDGWFAKQNREAKKSREQKELDGMMGGKVNSKQSNSNAGELFVMAKNQQEADKIRNVNDLTGQIKMKQRGQALEQKGRLEEHQLPDVQIQLRAEAMKQMSERFGKK